MKIFFVLLIVNVSTTLATIGQGDTTRTLKSNSVELYAGKLAYNNTINLPNGLPGYIFAVKYKRIWTATESKWTKDLTACLSSSGLRYHTETTPDHIFYRFNFASFGVGWHYRLGQILPNTELFLGVAPTLAAEFTYPTTEALVFSDNFSPFGLWGLNGNGRFRALHTIKRATIGWGIEYTLLGVGYVPKPPYFNLYLSYPLYTYYILPNAFYHLLNYQMLNTEFSISLPYNKQCYSVTYKFLYFFHSLAPLHQRYTQQSLGLGVTF
jgi:hypothetical protein